MTHPLNSSPLRLEPAGKIADVDYYNDTWATDVGATADVLVKFFDQSVILIAGGELRKRKILKTLSSLIQKKVRCLILFGKNRYDFYKLWGASTETYLVVNLKDAVSLAAKKSQKGNVVLFSPACPPDPRDPVDVEGRGEKFKKFVREILSKE